jgi:hypothetical protein
VFATAIHLHCRCVEAPGLASTVVVVAVVMLAVLVRPGISAVVVWSAQLT